MADSKGDAAFADSNISISSEDPPARNSSEPDTPDGSGRAREAQAEEATAKPYLLTATDALGNDGSEYAGEALAEEVKAKPYWRTKEFYITIALGQVLVVLNESTSVFSSLLTTPELHTSIPSFQNLFNYVLLNMVFTSYTIYRYGLVRWFRLVWKDGWKYILFSFCDVLGNYFVVLAFRYTTILSVQLILFWTIVVVVVISFLFMGVRYHIWQIAGILTCMAGMGLLVTSDHLTGSNGGEFAKSSQVKGDLFALVAATFYGLSNTAEEFLVSKRPVYEVLGQLGFWGTFIIGVIAAIFDRDSFQSATWNGQVAGYIIGYDLCLFFFYCLSPLLFRLASAAFFNISLLTGNFWNVIIGIRVFHLSVHWLYPIAFVLIIMGHFIYYFGRKALGESLKPWLGRNQEKGVSGVFTARKRIMHKPPPERNAISAV